MRLGFLVSPPVVGLVADAVGLRVGLLVVPLAGTLVLVLAGVLSAARVTQGAKGKTLEGEDWCAEAEEGRSLYD